MLKSELIVSGRNFSQAMSVIKITMRGTYRPAVGILSDQDCLKIRSGPLTTTVKGKGSFQGMVVLPLVYLLDYAETLSPEDEIKIRKLPASIGIGPLEFFCDWKEENYEIPDWPYKATLAQIIGLEQRYDREILDYHLLSNTIGKAKARLAHLLEEAAVLLHETGIDYDDLEMLMEDVIKRSAEEDKESVIW